MSKKQWLVLLMLFLTYLLLGASIFHHIESRVEVERIKKAKQERIEINALLHKHYMPTQHHDQHEIFGKLTKYCGKSVYNHSEGDSERQKWDFYNSFYFAYTVVSTIGYGNLAPTNMLSRILMIFYALVGIPMNGILLAQLGEFFGQVFIRAHEKYKSYKHESGNYWKKLESRKAGLAMQILVYLIPGFVMFIFFPAFLFSYYEGWDYDEAVYYAFVTLTTIGFGDYVAGQDNTRGSGVFFIMYKTFLIAWISFGLGYIVMIMTFITRGMRSKKIKYIEHKLAMNLKHTQSKIWNEFNKEVNYLRRVFNELQLSKVKRVYVDEGELDVPPTKFPRSNSFPDLRDLLYGGLECPMPPHPRRRANSEVVPMEEQLTRVVSETDLQRIDKTATFAAHAMVQPAELLARLVNILGYIPPSPPDDINDTPSQEETQTRQRKTGIDGFDAKEILASENGWNGFPPLSVPRSRAASEIRLHDARNEILNMQQRNMEWTWSGPTATKKIQELIKARKTLLTKECKDTSEDTKSNRFPSMLGLSKSVPKMLFPKWRRQSSNKKTMDENETKTSEEKPIEINDRRSSFDLGEKKLSKFYFTHTGADLPSLLEGKNLLEETSLADFLRALTVVHSRAGSVPDIEQGKKPQRKMGTASLTPPKLPSLFTLFSTPPPGSNVESNQNTVMDTQLNQFPRRRSSVGPKAMENYSGSSTPSYARRRSLAPRRFSLRPVHTPTGTPPHYDSPSLSKRILRATVDHTQDQSFMDFESSTKPFIQLEGAPGVSSPIASTSNLRRFSLRPAQIGMPPAPSSRNRFISTGTTSASTLTTSTVTTAPTMTATSTSSTKVPRWKPPILQRRRIRAFSLSDVSERTSQHENSMNLSPLVMDDATKLTSIINKNKDQSSKLNNAATDSSSVQKIVTIVSPTESNIFEFWKDQERSAISRNNSDLSSHKIPVSPFKSDTDRIPDDTLFIPPDLSNKKDESGEEYSSIKCDTIKPKESREVGGDHLMSVISSSPKLSDSETQNITVKPHEPYEMESLTEVKVEKPQSSTQPR